MSAGVNNGKNGPTGTAPVEGSASRNSDSQCSVVGNTGLAVNPILTLTKAGLRPTHYSFWHRLRHDWGYCHKARLGYDCKGYSEC